MNLLSVLLFLEPAGTPVPTVVPDVSNAVQDTVTFWIAIIGSLLGLAGFIISLVSILRHKRKIEVTRIAEHYFANKHCTRFHELIISNLSMSPLSIDYMYLKDDNDEYLISSFTEIELDEELNSISDTTAVLPITIPPYESFRGIFAFEPQPTSKSTFESIVSSSIILKLITTRGVIDIKAKNRDIILK